jgi:hypothetical protein
MILQQCTFLGGRRPSALIPQILHGPTKKLQLEVNQYAERVSAEMAVDT